MALRFSVFFLFLFIACGGSSSSVGEPTVTPDNDASTDAAVGPDATAPGDVTAALAARGLGSLPGSFEFIDLASCCATNCAGNNPASPYAAFYLPPGPGQSAANPTARADGTANAYRLRADEAIVYVGTTPPEADYFGFTPYLMDRDGGGGDRQPIFASLSETLNQLVIGTDAPAGSAPFDRRTAIIASGDATTTASVKDALVASGLPPAAINTIVFDPAKSRFGLDAAGDTFGVLFRLAHVKDAAKQAAYLASPPSKVYRVTPTAPRAPAPLATPPARPKDTQANELALRPAVQKLSDAISAAYPTHTSAPLLVQDGESDPTKCIDQLRFCAGDNRDTLYPGMLPRVLFASDDDFYVVFGVDHEVARKVTYASFSVYALEHLVGLTGVTSERYPGSAAKYLPGDADAAKLYAWKIARACKGEPFCLEIPKGGCPTGIENGKAGMIYFRTYLEPTTKTAPDTATLVRDRILRFTKI